MELESPGPLPVRADVAAWRLRETRYRNASWRGVAAQISVQEFGTHPVVITAPHAGHQLRNSWPKPADGGTGGLAETVAEATGSAVVTVCGVQADDPNWDSEVRDFKRAVARLYADHTFSVDIHAMRTDRFQDICFGLGPSPDIATLEYARRCAAVARAAGYAVAINHPFPAARIGTMTSFAQASGRRGMQIEVNARHLDPDGKPERAARIIELLSRFVRGAPV